MPARKAPPGPFEGAKWVVTLTPDKDAEKTGEKPIEDALWFEGAKFSSHVGKEHGFPPARFERGQNWARAECIAQDGRSKVEWRLEAKGDRVEGTMVSTRGEGTIVNYKVEGLRASPLEGTRWAIKIEPEEKDKKDETKKPVFDSLVFTCGKLKRGAGSATAAATYTLTKTGDKQVLSAEALADSGERTVWSAEFEKDTVKGVVRTSTKDGKETTQTFEGTKMAEPREDLGK